MTTENLKKSEQSLRSVPSNLTKHSSDLHWFLLRWWDSMTGQFCQQSPWWGCHLLRNWPHLPAVLYLEKRLILSLGDKLSFGFLVLNLRQLCYPMSHSTISSIFLARCFYFLIFTRVVDERVDTLGVPSQCHETAVGLWVQPVCVQGPDLGRLVVGRGEDNMVGHNQPEKETNNS